MNRYQNIFTTEKEHGRAAFIPFAVAGDPDIDTSTKILQAYIDAGADILEIGYPFSDPIADGPVNQKASNRAIEAGISPSSFFSMIKKLRNKNPFIPFGLLIYANTIHHIGSGLFCRKCADAGIDSILVADMPPEEAGQFLKIMKKENLKSVFIVSELTPDNRIKLICKQTTGFIYIVSRLGTTGVNEKLDSHAGKTIKKLKRLTDLPLCVGFGISSPEHARQVIKAGADGAIVGSRLVSIIEKYGSNKQKMLKNIKKNIKAFKLAVSGE